MTALAFVDLETTGANAALDRITEIGIVEVDADGSVRTWQQLVNPGIPIPPFIEQLTGISNRMVASAPSFAEVAGAALERLRGRTFLAHNARFDYGFLKSEFRRQGHNFRAEVVCTVKLSRALYPEHRRHNLDSLVERHQLQAEARHRALADAQLIHQFWQKIHVDRSPAAIEAALRQQNARPILPPQLPAGALDALPDEAGAYVFFDATGRPLTSGHTRDLRQKILGQFGRERRSAREEKIFAATTRIEWREASGEFGARLQEARWQQELASVRPRPPRSADPRLETRLLWPFPGPVLLREGGEIHVIDHWRHLGAVRAAADIPALLARPRPAFDAGIYPVLARFSAQFEPWS